MSRLQIVEFEPQDMPELVALWRASFEFGVGITDPHPIEQQIEYFHREVQPRHHVRLAKEGGQITGFLASNSQSIAQLYVRTDRLGRGIGTQLLNLAKGDSAGSLWLYTFKKNARACRFYEHNAFKAVKYGFEPMWRLEDVRYEWSNAQSAA